MKLYRELEPGEHPDEATFFIIRAGQSVWLRPVAASEIPEVLQADQRTHEARKQVEAFRERAEKAEEHVRVESENARQARVRAACARKDEALRKIQKYEAALAEGCGKELLAELERLRNLCEIAWGVIANAGAGNWERESKEWQGAAAKWRDDWRKITPPQEKKEHGCTCNRINRGAAQHSSICNLAQIMVTLPQEEKK